MCTLYYILHPTQEKFVTVPPPHRPLQVAIPLADRCAHRTPPAHGDRPGPRSYFPPKGDFPQMDDRPDLYFYRWVWSPFPWIRPNPSVGETAPRSRTWPGNRDPMCSVLPPSPEVFSQRHWVRIGSVSVLSVGCSQVFFVKVPSEKPQIPGPQVGKGHGAYPAASSTLPPPHPRTHLPPSTPIR